MNEVGARGKSLRLRPARGALHGGERAACLDVVVAHRGRHALEDSRLKTGVAISSARIRRSSAVAPLVGDVSSALEDAEELGRLRHPASGSCTATA